MRYSFTERALAITVYKSERNTKYPNHKTHFSFIPFGRKSNEKGEFTFIDLNLHLRIEKFIKFVSRLIFMIVSQNQLGLRKDAAL